MIPILLCFILINAAAFPLQENKATRRDSTLKQCTVKGDEEIADDGFVEQMFTAFKEETLMKGPRIEGTAKELKDVGGNELLSRLLSYIDASLHAAIGGKDANKVLKKLTDVSERYQSDGPSLASEHLWPYRCYNAETTKVLDVYLSDVLLQIVALVRNRDESLAMFLHAVFMNIPQFQGYVGEMVKASMTSMCSLIEESQSQELTVQSILKVLEKLSTETQIAKVACRPPHSNHDFCLLSKIVTPLQLFLVDYKNAGSSVMLKRFAFFWFFEPNLSYFCSDSGKKFKAKILSSFASFEVKELKAIMEFSTQQDYQKIRSFISQHVFNHFTRYITGERATHSKSELGSPFHKREYPSEKPTYNFLKCFRVFLTTLLQMDEAISSNGPAAKIRALAKVSLLWFTHPDFGAKITGMRETCLEGLGYILEDIAALKTFGMSLAGCGERVCRTGAGSSPLPFCEINAVLEDIKLLATSLSFSPKTKILTPLTADYRRMLSDEEFWTSIPSTVNEIGTEEKKRWSRKSFVSMGNKVTELFARSADLAHTEAEYKAKALLRMIETFLRSVGEVDFAGKLSHLFREVFQLVGAKVQFTEMAKALASAIVNSPNPFRWLTDVPSVEDVLGGRTDPAISGNANRQLERIFGDTSRLLYAKASEISKVVASKSKFHKKIKELLKSLTENNAEIKNAGLDESEEVQDNTMEFLREHTKPNSILFLSREDIEECTALVKDLIEKSCDILYKRKTANPSTSQPIETTKATCLNIRNDARLTSAIYKEMHEFQFEFMEIIASISRATSIQQQSNEMGKKILRTIDSVAELKPEIHKYQIKVQAKMHIHQAVSAICDEIEYKNGGEQIEACHKASLTLVQDDVMRVLTITNNECPSAQTRNLHVRIPASLNPNKEFLEKGHVDLTSLYEGKVTVFEIPFSQNLPWLHKFASSELPTSPDIAMYVKRFELFLPDMTDPLQPIAYNLKIAINRGNFNKPMPSGETKYAFADPNGFHLSYGENQKQCIVGLKDSPYPKLCEQPSPICIERRGELLANETAQSLYSKWLIQASIPRGLPTPKPYPGTAFYLRAVMSICVSNPKNIDMSGTLAHPVTITSLSGDCCPRGGFWNIDQYLPSVQFCLQCPQNSNPMLGGLYCHDTTQSVRSKKTKHKKKISKHD